ncbi:MAG: trypsin-like peptidase domain-containing protein [Proteobacteria bacterium]|nr:trypsin-like peptidase domain-containing protein [Pseudomonadota bacterium]
MPGGAGRLALWALMWLLQWLWPLGAVAQQLPDTIERVKPSVVLVGTYVSTDNPRFRYVGAGFVVGDGLRVVTSAHVVTRMNMISPDGQALAVQVRSGEVAWVMRKAKVMELNLEQDLALLQIDGPPVAPLKVASSDRLREGDELAFMGFPIGGVLGYSSVTHRAGVSSITTMALPSPTSQQLSERAVLSLRAGPVQVLQLDASAYPGNSGGPLFDQRSGAVLGVMSMVQVKSTRESALTQPTGISYAIPSRYVLEMLARHSAAP